MSEEEASVSRDQLAGALLRHDQAEAFQRTRMEMEMRGERFEPDCGGSVVSGDPPCGECESCVGLKIVSGFQSAWTWERYRARATALLADIRAQAR